MIELLGPKQNVLSSVDKRPRNAVTRSARKYRGLGGPTLAREVHAAPPAARACSHATTGAPAPGPIAGSDPVKNAARSPPRARAALSHGRCPQRQPSGRRRGRQARHRDAPGRLREPAAKAAATVVLRAGHGFAVVHRGPRAVVSAEPPGEGAPGGLAVASWVGAPFVGLRRLGPR